MADVTIYRMLQATVARFPARAALGYRADNTYRYVTYQELWERVRAVRRGLAALGVRRGDRVALLSENRPEWAVCDLAVQGIGAATVAIYPTLPTVQVQYVVGDSAARVLIVSDAKQLAKAVALQPNVRTLERVVVMQGDAPDGALTLDDVVERGRQAGPSDEELDAAEAATVRPEDDATLIYTSGTTGDPKGAALSHTGLLYTGTAARQFVPLTENDVFLSFLPLCHVIERVGGHYLPLSIGALIVYSEGVFAIANELATVHPTVFLCVPRLFENMQEKIAEQAAKRPDRERRAFEWALGIGLRAAELRLSGKSPGPLLALQRLVADRLVLRKVRERVTGGRLRFLVSGGAPLNPKTALFFDALGICLLEGYGLTEFPVICLNRPGEARMGTVGPPLPGIEVRIAPDGEIMARGPSRMRGYLGKPEATREAIDPEGWFHTGDVGVVQPAGHVHITDRKKDIIVLANGKNVAPQPIEAALKQSPYIQEIVLIGDRQNSIVAIVVPAFDRLRTWAKRTGIPATSMAEVLRRAETRKLVKDEIDQLSEGLADFERIKRFTLVEQPFSIESGELTPTLKVKRKVVAQKYADVIEQMAR